MITKIRGEQPFQVLTDSFSISPSQEGYTLQISADGKQYSNLFTVGAGVTRLVTGVAANSYYRLSGNQSEVSVNWVRSCGGEGGGGAAGNELAPVSEFPLGAMPGTVVAYSGASSAAGVYMYDGTDWNSAGGDVDLSNYYTSAQTEEKIASAVTPVANHLAEVEQITASALTELHNGLLEVSGRTVDLSGYYTSAQTEDAISAATSGKADAANVTANTTMKFPLWNEQGVITGTVRDAYDMNININGTNNAILRNNIGNIGPIYGPTTPGTAGDILVSTGNGAPVWSAMPAADVTKAYVDSADTALQTQIDTLDEVVATSLVDLNTRVDEISAATPSVDLSGYYTSAQTEDAISSALTPYYTSAQTNTAISAATQDMVTSTTVRQIVKLTQAEYDILTPKDPYTFYIIVNSN